MMSTMTKNLPAVVCFICTFIAIPFVIANEQPGVELIWKQDMRDYRDVRAKLAERAKFHQSIKDEFQSYFDEFKQRYLSEGDTLKVEIVQLDLAGRLEIMGSSQRRIVQDVDFPSMTLKYQLTDQDGKTLTSGEQTIRDMMFLTRIEARGYHNLGFPYEKVLIHDFYRNYLLPYLPSSTKIE